MTRDRDLVMQIFWRFCYFFQNGPELAQFFSLKAIFSLSTKWRHFLFKNILHCRQPIYWWQPGALWCSVQTIHLLLLNSLLYTNLGSGSNPGLSNKISWPELIFLKVLYCLGFIKCPILYCIRLWAKSKISLYRPYLHCAPLGCLIQRNWGAIDISTCHYWYLTQSWFVMGWECPSFKHKQWR